jgi:hypothetical protein
MKRLVLNLATILFFGGAIAMLGVSLYTLPDKLEQYETEDYWRICEQYPEAKCGQ